MNKLPVLSVDLIKELDKLYPEKCPSLKDTDRDIWMYVGMRSVVNGLLSRVKLKEDNLLEDDDE